MRLREGTNSGIFRCEAIRADAFAARTTLMWFLRATRREPSAGEVSGAGDRLRIDGDMVRMIRLDEAGTLVKLSNFLVFEQLAEVIVANEGVAGSPPL